MKKETTQNVIGIAAIGLTAMAGGVLYAFYTPSPHNENREGSPLPQVEVSEVSSKTSDIADAEITGAEIDEVQFEQTRSGREEPKSVLSASAVVPVPFTSQAPLGKWDPPYHETCEEAALIMVRAFLQDTPLDVNAADRELLSAVDWQTAHFGYYEDTTVEEMARMAEEAYGLKAHVEYAVSIDRIKEEIANGKPVIVPTAGRVLQNPHFTPPGPWYHHLVIIGYDGEDFITNDPGTKFGEHYRYPQEVVLKAVHNWVGNPQLIEQGEKAMLVFD